MTPVDQAFVLRSKAIGKEYADTLRRWLPVTLLVGAEGSHARFVIQIAARHAKEQLANAARHWVAYSTPEAVRLGGEKAAKWLSRLDTVVVRSRGVVFGGVNQRLVATLMKDNLSKLLKVSNAVPALAAQQLREATKAISKDAKISKALADGILDRPTMAKLSSRVLNATGLSKGDPVIYSNGAVWNAEDYAKMTARTRTMEATNRGFETMLVNMDQDYVFYPEHSGVLETDICFALQGKVWALSEDNALGLPTLASIGREGAPWHPNCSHTPSPWVVALKTDAEIAEAIAAHDSDAEMLSKVTN